MRLLDNRAAAGPEKLAEICESTSCGGGQGIMTADDALLALEAGASAIVVSIMVPGPGPYPWHG